MDDRTIMENLLLTTKGALDLYTHGAIESGTQPVRAAFESALTDTLSMQDSIYKQMTAKGWYQNQAAPSNQIDALRQKFPPTCC